MFVFGHRKKEDEVANQQMKTLLKSDVIDCKDTTVWLCAFMCVDFLYCNSVLTSTNNKEVGYLYILYKGCLPQFPLIKFFIF